MVNSAEHPDARFFGAPFATDPGDGTARPANLARRIAMAVVIALVTVNIWTGAPLAALWIGSLAAGGHALSMRGVCVVVIAFAALAYGLAVLLTWLNAIYDELAGRPPGGLGPVWLRNPAQSSSAVTRRARVTALEAIVVMNVYTAVIALVAWYVFLVAKPFSTFV